MILPPKYWIYDEETYPNVFTLSTVRQDGQHMRTFECSEYKNDIVALLKYVKYLQDNNCTMVGFNNLGFDYPVLHKLLKLPNLENLSGEKIAKFAYKFAQEQIDSTKDGFAHLIKESEWMIPQVDLFRIWHFDNKAKSTSLKLLEFNMRSHNIEDLPYPVGTVLTQEQIEKLCSYNRHDVRETLQFFNHSKSHVDFREVLTERYGRNFMNHNDTKIGKDYFVMRLEEAGIPPYTIVKGRREWKQTKRNAIIVKDCLFDYYDFERPEFIAIFEWMKNKRLRETKGVFADIPEHLLGDVAKYANMRVIRRKFDVEPGEELSEMQRQLFKAEYPLGWIEEIELKAKKKGKPVIAYWKNWRVADNLNVVIDGFEFVFGTGGIHGSIANKVAKETASYEIIDADVSSMYPNLGISNKVYPLHLTGEFCTIYLDVYEQRKSFKKGTPENAMLKLALNGVYGDSNNQYGPFYDPQYTMTITLNGQLSLCLLAEKLMKIPGLKIIQVNTDGITVANLRENRAEYDRICKEWQEQVKLELEFAYYKKMYIRDVNNYIALYTNGKVKRKGVYQYEDLGWHQNQSALVIQKAAEAQMLFDIPIEEFVKKHEDKFDFMLRTKVPRTSKLVLRFEDGFDLDGNQLYRDEQLQNVCRYYPCTSGGKLIKIMPPLPKKPGVYREIGIDAMYNVHVCNNMDDYKGDIDYSYYISEARKLLVPKVVEDVTLSIDRSDDSE